MSEEICNIFNFNSPDCNLENCFNTFDQTKSGSLNIHDFKQLCYALFKSNEGYKYLIRAEKARDLFIIFDKDNDNVINKNEFTFMWNKWIKKILHPKSALIIVDIQNDFITGPLSVSQQPMKENPKNAIKAINNLLETVDFDAIVYTLDWHPKNHISFLENVQLHPIHHSSRIQSSHAKMYDSVVFSKYPKMKQKLWPTHCVQGTPGAKIHDELIIVPDSITIRKGDDPEIDAYSAFFDNTKQRQTELHSKLAALEITDVYVCGIAWDYCVGYTAKDSLRLGYRTAIIQDCTVGMDAKVVEEMKSNFTRLHGLITQCSKVANITKGLDRRPELAFALAANHLKK